MFVAHDVLLDVSFGVARPRLATLTSGHALADASRVAYAEGRGPGSGPGRELARVRLLPPVERRDAVTVGLRWETTGEVVGLFPVLDADITLAAAGEHSATLTLSGVYRSPCPQPSPVLWAAPLAAPVLHGVAEPGPPLPPEPTGPGPQADVAIRALLRYAAGHLSGLIS